MCYSVVQNGRCGTELQDLRSISSQKCLNSLRIGAGCARQCIFRKELWCSVSVSGLLPVIEVGDNLTRCRNSIEIAQILVSSYVRLHTLP